jgi:hypothetical protein
VIGHAQHSSVGGVLSRMTECGSAPSHEQSSRRTMGRGKLTLVWVWFKLFEDRGYVGLSNLCVQNVSSPSGSEWRQLYAEKHQLHGCAKRCFQHQYNNAVQYNIVSDSTVQYKRKEILVQAWTDPERSRRLRLPDFKTIST